MSTVTTRIVLAGLICSIFIQIAGYVSPGWIFIKLKEGNSTMEVHAGLWYQVVCVDKDCKTENRNRRLLQSDVWTIGVSTKLQDHRAETTVAIIGSAIAIASIILFVCKEKFSPKAFIRIMTTVIATTVSGVLCLIAAGSQLNYVLYLAADTETFTQGFPYSLFLFGIGGIINCLLSCLLTWFIIAYGTVSPGLSSSTILKNGTGNDSDHPLTRL